MKGLLTNTPLLFDAQSFPSRWLRGGSSCRLGALTTSESSPHRILAGCLNRWLHNCLCSLPQSDTRTSLFTPLSRRRGKHFRVIVDELSLLLGRELHHGPRLIRKAQRRKDLPSDSEIRVVMVFMFLCTGRVIASLRNWSGVMRCRLM